MQLCYCHMCVQLQHSDSMPFSEGPGQGAVMRNSIQTLRTDRRAFIGGSDARIIMGNDKAALIQLWREKRGETEPEDLSSNLVVQLGAATEALNRTWYERNTGRRVSNAQRQVKHSAIPWMAATLDGIVEGAGAVFEAKFMLPWSFSEEAAAEKYMAQVQHNREHRGPQVGDPCARSL